MRQDHGPPDDCRTRVHNRRHHPDRRADRQRRRAARSRHRDGVPKLRALSAHECGGEHRVSLADAGGIEVRDQKARQRGCRHPRAHRVARPQTRPAVRRPETARGDGSSDRPRAERVLDGRAPFQPRREAARPDARRGGPGAEAHRSRHGLCHPRPDRSDDSRRQCRRHALGRLATVRCAPGALRSAGEHFCGWFHWLTGDEPARRRAFRRPRITQDRLTAHLVAGRRGRHASGSETLRRGALDRRDPTRGAFCRGRTRRQDSARSRCRARGGPRI